MRRESVQSIAQAARRVGSVVTVVGEQNLKILCEVNLQRPMGLAWHVDGIELPVSEVSRLLDVAQQGA